MEYVKQVLDKKGREVWTITPQTKVEQALELMKEKNVGALPVVEDGSIQGIFSERDFVRSCVGLESVSLDVRVKDLMTKKVTCIGPEQKIENCMHLMTDKRMRHLPVLENGTLVGMISIGDAVKAVIADKEFLIDQLEHYIEGSL
ncbi:MAG: CBS domain-containing protein [Spirochaetia bacterium]